MKVHARTQWRRYFRRRTDMSDLRNKLSVAVIGVLASSTALAGALPPAPIATPVMGPWALGLMAALVAAIAYGIKKK